MKKLLLTTTIVAGLALPALAQDAPQSPFQAEPMGASVAASEMIGARIYASEGAVDAESYAGMQDGWEDIGEVNDVILSRDGTVDAVLVDIGGFLGIGERQVAVDMSSLRIVQDDATDADDWFLVMQADRATLEGAPEWAMPNAAGQMDGAAVDGTMTDPAMTDDATQTGVATDGTATAPMTDDMAQTGMATDGTTTGTMATDGTAMAPGTMALPEGYVEMDRQALTAETLTGANVHDANDASIAEVSDLVLTADGQVTDVVLDVGGFLGIGAKTVAIPMDRLTVAQREGGDVTLWVNMSQEELEALPEYEM